MKQRTTLLLLACALLIAPLSGFAAPLASMATAACAATSSTAPPPFFAPASSTSVTKAALIGPVCGSCSPSPCAGAKVGSIVRQIPAIVRQPEQACGQFCQVGEQPL